MKKIKGRGTKSPSIVAIGGGTGLSTMLRGLKLYTKNLTAIVTVTDDGGGSGVLRQELGMPPPGDIRNCIQALARTEETVEQLLDYRFEGGHLAGQSFGNLLLAALTGISATFDEAVAKMNDVLAVCGRVLPVTNENIWLEAEFRDGSVVSGESNILKRKKGTDFRIRQVRLCPKRPAALPDCLRAIEQADMVILGPGSLYTSIIPNLLVDGICEAIASSRAVKVYVCNIMTQDGETEGYWASDHLKAILSHGGEGLVDICLCNSMPIGEELLARYILEDAEPVPVDREELESLGVEARIAPIALENNDLARHDTMALAKELMKIFNEKTGSGL